MRTEWIANDGKGATINDGACEENAAATRGARRSHPAVVVTRGGIDICINARRIMLWVRKRGGCRESGVVSAFCFLSSALAAFTTVSKQD